MGVGGGEVQGYEVEEISAERGFPGAVVVVGCSEWCFIHLGVLFFHAREMSLWCVSGVHLINSESILSTLGAHKSALKEIEAGKEAKQACRLYPPAQRSAIQVASTVARSL